MLDITEKIAAGACGLLILLTIGWYAFWGIPTTTPTEAIPAARPRPPAPAPPGAANEVERAKASAEDQAIIEKLAQQDVRVTLGQPLAKEDLQVDRLLLDHLKTEANWIPEINKLASRPIRVNGKKTDTRLKIFDIQPDSVAAKLGLQENDEILLLDAQIIE
ncbi:MAG: hypothetical protein HY721_30675, partial [Planctomycetes bacterium]|nr:hypothetical protein [Planctomycetota bacterium]